MIKNEFPTRQGVLPQANYFLDISACNLNIFFFQS